MYRFALAVCRVLIVRVRTWVPNRPLTCFARIAITAIFLYWQGQALFAQNKNVLRIPSDSNSIGSSIRSYHPQVVEPVPIAIVYQPAAQDSEPDTKNDQVPSGGADDQPAKDEANENNQFKIASVDDEISQTPFGKLKLPENRPEEKSVKKFGEMPVVFSPNSYFAMTSTPEMPRTFAWKSPDFYHRPLYFEEPNLERYGHYVPLVQPAISAAHFFGRIPSLPYLVGTYPPCEPTYTYGHYRPGSCNPHRLSRPPLSFQGLLLKGVVTTGIIFALP